MMSLINIIESYVICVSMVSVGDTHSDCGDTCDMFVWLLIEMEYCVVFKCHGSTYNERFNSIKVVNCPSLFLQHMACSSFAQFCHLHANGNIYNVNNAELMTTSFMTPSFTPISSFIMNDHIVKLS